MAFKKNSGKPSRANPSGFQNGGYDDDFHYESLAGKDLVGGSVDIFLSAPTLGDPLDSASGNKPSRKKKRQSLKEQPPASGAQPAQYPRGVNQAVSFPVANNPFVSAAATATATTTATTQKPSSPYGIDRSLVERLALFALASREMTRADLEARLRRAITRRIERIQTRRDRKIRESAAKDSLVEYDVPKSGKKPFGSREKKSGYKNPARGRRSIDDPAARSLAVLLERADEARGVRKIDHADGSSSSESDMTTLLSEDGPDFVKDVTHTKDSGSSGKAAARTPLPAEITVPSDDEIGEWIEDVCSVLQKRGWLDDARAALGMVRQGLRRGEAVMRLRQRLERSGVGVSDADKGLIEGVAQFMDEGRPSGDGGSVMRGLGEMRDKPSGMDSFDGLDPQAGSQIESQMESQKPAVEDLDMAETRAALLFLRRRSMGPFRTTPENNDLDNVGAENHGRGGSSTDSAGPGSDDADPDENDGRISAASVFYKGCGFSSGYSEKESHSEIDSENNPEDDEEYDFLYSAGGEFGKKRRNARKKSGGFGSRKKPVRGGGWRKSDPEEKARQKALSALARRGFSHDRSSVILSMTREEAEAVLGDI